MTSAKVQIKGNGRDLGWWEFSHLPRTGELLALTVDEAPVSFEVAGIIHIPVVQGTIGDGKHPVPWTVVIVEEPNPVEKVG